MATHYQSCKEIFKERVLPHFPHAKERFRNHFRESYGLIRSLEAPLDGNSPMTRFTQDDIRESEYRAINLDLAFTILGAKPLLTDIPESEIIRQGFTRFRDAGLDVYQEKDNEMKFTDDTGKVYVEYPTVWIYDPVMIAPMLSELLNTPVPQEKVRKMLRRYENDIARSHTLLGYADRMPGRIRKGLNMGFEVTSEGHGSQPYCSEGMGFRVFDVGNTYGKLEGWALAAALIEEIRESPLAIISHAGIIEWPRRTTFKDFLIAEDYASCTVVAEAVVSRQKGDWLVLRYNTSCEEFGRKSA